MLAGQEEMRPILRRMVGVCDYMDELRATGCTAEQFGLFLTRFNHAYAAFAGRQYGEAERLLTDAAVEQPQSAAVAVALAATQTAEHQFLRAEGTLARAVRLRPGDAELVELHRRVTILSRRGNTPPETLAAGPVPLQPSDVLDGWKLEQLLGRGGWGQVWKASRAGQVAALKTMHPELGRDPSFVERFKREIKALMRLDHHASLVEIDTFGYDRGSWYFVMQYVEGVAVENHLGRHGALNWEQARPLFTGFAEALALAHTRGIIHRDIKPANLLLRPDGSGVLVDFGLAGLVDSSGNTGKAGYTPLFAAPEQLRSGQADARADVFSLAATLYYSLLYNDRARREPHCFKAALVPEAVRMLLSRSLDNDPAERPADAAAFLAALRENSAGHEAKSGKTAPQAGNVIQNSLGIKFAWCPPGTFLMGSPQSEPQREGYDGADETQHRVTVSKGFYLGIHPVTQAQWHAVMGNSPSHFKGDDRPVEQVSWEHCQEFCKKLGEQHGKRHRLPTEAEWEYACRAGTSTPFYFGANVTTDQVNYDGDPYNNAPKGKNRATTTAVGSFPANTWGLCDMHGNVWEWCQDWFGRYPEFDVMDPQGDGAGENRVLRGGSWYNDAAGCRSAYRDGEAPGFLAYAIGCRVVLCLD